MSDNDLSRAVEDAAAIVQGMFPGSRRLSYKDMVAQASTVEGATLEKDKEFLCGVPFVITSVTVRDGVLRGAGANKSISNYVSVEATIADADTLTFYAARKRISQEQLQRIIPEEQVVFNDGSTGIARQIIAFLHLQGMIVVPEGSNGGAMGESRWDIYRNQWDIKQAVNDWESEDPRFEFLLNCPRGLRVSTYDSDYNPDGGTTFYLG